MRIYRKNTFFEDESGFLIKKYNAQIRTYLHNHDFIEIVFVVTGSGNHIIDSTEFGMTGGMLFIVPSGVRHSLFFSGESEYYNIFITNKYAKKIKLLSPPFPQGSLYELVNDQSRQINPVYLSNTDLNTVSELITLIFTEWNTKREFYTEVIAAALKTLSCLLCRNIQEKNSHLTKEHSADILPRLIDYVNIHYNEKITLKSIAAVYHYNPAYLGRLFSKTYGITLNEYLYRKKLEKAKELLISTDCSIADIASSVGFPNTSSFYNRFKTLFSLTPKEYRQRNTAADRKHR